MGKELTRRELRKGGGADCIQAKRAGARWAALAPWAGLWVVGVDGHQDDCFDTGIESHFTGVRHFFTGTDALF